MENDCLDITACRGGLVQFVGFQDYSGRCSSTKSPLSNTRTPFHWAKLNSAAWESLAWLHFGSGHILDHAVVKDVPESFIVHSPQKICTISLRAKKFFIAEEPYARQEWREEEGKAWQAVTHRKYTRPRSKQRMKN